MKAPFIFDKDPCRFLHFLKKPSKLKPFKSQNKVKSPYLVSQQDQDSLQRKQRCTQYYSCMLQRLEGTNFCLTDTWAQAVDVFSPYFTFNFLTLFLFWKSWWLFWW